MSQPTAFITGATSGIGKATALQISTALPAYLMW